QAQARASARKRAQARKRASAQARKRASAQARKRASQIDTQMAEKLPKNRFSGGFFGILNFPREFPGHYSAQKHPKFSNLL
ncbi:MAG: hypothetical protein GY770_02675, partial [Aestuariibacter sp.]|nr:hypothetical protein [Aestuariibacter sp.]